MLHRLYPLCLLVLVAGGAGCAADRFAAMAPVPAQVPEEVTTIYLVRHAERAPGQGDVSISEAGRLRALALRDTLRRSGLDGHPRIPVSAHGRDRRAARRGAAPDGLAASAQHVWHRRRCRFARAHTARRLCRAHGPRRRPLEHDPRHAGRAHRHAPRRLRRRRFDGLYRVRLVRGSVVSSTRMRYGADDGVPDPIEPPR